MDTFYSVALRLYPDEGKRTMDIKVTVSTVFHDHQLEPGFPKDDEDHNVYPVGYGWVNEEPAGGIKWIRNGENGEMLNHPAYDERFTMSFRSGCLIACK